MEALEKQGYPLEFLEGIFFDARLRRVNKVIGLNAIIRESEQEVESQWEK